MIDIKTLKNTAKYDNGGILGDTILKCVEEIERLRAENEKIRAVFRVNMLRAFSNMTHEEIDAEINRVLENKDEN